MWATFGNPHIDLCWDISRGIPLKNYSLRGIFTEHCLEHFPLAVAETIIAECHRLLRPGGRIRIIVPDAELYLTGYTDPIRGVTEVLLPYERPNTPPIVAVNRVFYQDREHLAGHRFMYNFDFLRTMLLRHGFAEVIRASCATGADKILLIDSAHRAVESLFVEATALDSHFTAR